MMEISLLCCPVCGAGLFCKEKTLVCESGHSFDIAKEGYVNLLRSSKSGDRIGDDKLSARSRRDFLNKGYYSVLREYLQDLFSEKSGNVLDICCGEGYYTEALGKNPNLSMYGFDISKEMVRLGAKRGNGTFFVANLSAIPVLDMSFDYGIHLFAPFQEKEFLRVLKPGGKLYSVVPGKCHLFGLKEAIYQTPYYNDEKLPSTENLKLTNTTVISDSICLNSREDIEAVFRMTPYYFHTSREDMEKLERLTTLETEISFVIGEYTRDCL